MERNEWLARCAAQYETRAGLTHQQATELAEIALAEDSDGDFAETPEVAADSDLECWDDDGEK